MKSEIKRINTGGSTNSAIFNEFLQNTSKDMQTNGLDVEIQYKCNYNSKDELYHSAIIIGRKYHKNAWQMHQIMI